MKPHCAVGYVSGFLSLSSQKEKKEDQPTNESPQLYPPSLTDEEKKKVSSAIELSERMNNGGLTIPLRWCLLYLDEPPASYCNHLYQAWAARPPTFEEFHHYLRGYFEIVGGSTTLNHTQVKILMAELTRVNTPLPPRFQSLFFELGDYVFSYEGKEAPLVDVRPLVDSLQARSVDFPPLSLPKLKGEEKKEEQEVGQREEEKDDSTSKEEAGQDATQEDSLQEDPPQGEKEESPPAKKRNPPRRKKA